LSVKVLIIKLEADCTDTLLLLASKIQLSRDSNNLRDL
jgi:hypothetical protein